MDTHFGQIVKYMSENKSEKLICKDFKPIIEKAIKELKDGENRFVISDSLVKYPFISEFPNPDFSERVSSDYGVPSNNKEIEADYFEEVRLLKQLIKEADIQINLSNWQISGNKSGEDMWKELNIQAYSIQLWDWYAIPLRYKNNAIYIIWPPQDVYQGTPIIHSYPIDFFLKILSGVLEKQTEDHIKTLKMLNLWKNFGMIVLTIFIIFVLTKLLIIMN